MLSRHLLKRERNGELHRLSCWLCFGIIGRISIIFLHGMHSWLLPGKLRYDSLHGVLCGHLVSDRWRLVLVVMQCVRGWFVSKPDRQLELLKLPKRPLWNRVGKHLRGCCVHSLCRGYVPEYGGPNKLHKLPDRRIFVHGGCD